MTNEARKNRFLSDKPEVELTTADLGAARQLSPATAEEESVLEAEVVDLSSDTPPIEVARTGPDGAAPRASSAHAVEDETGPLFSNAEAKNLRARWDTIQVGFVDEPRLAVQQADSLVAETMKRLAEIFAEERSNLEAQWDKDGNASTEDLRQALRHYRSFFSRLLAI